MKLFLSGAMAFVVLGAPGAFADTALESETSAVAEVAEVTEEVLAEEVVSEEVVSEEDVSTVEVQVDGEAQEPSSSLDAATETATVQPEVLAREEYSPGYDFNSALASHVIVEQTAGVLDELIEAIQEGSDRRAMSLINSLDVLSLAFPEFDHKALSASAENVGDLNLLKEKWLTINGETEAYDLGPTDGVVGRSLVMLSDYLNDVYSPRLQNLLAAEDLAQSNTSPLHLYFTFLGVQSVLQFDAQPKYDTITLYGTLGNAAEISRGLHMVRNRLEAIRRLTVEVRKGTLNAEKQTKYKEQLSVVANEIETFAALLRRSASNG